MNEHRDNKKKKVGAVMVVGGGIAGMQSALDLVNSGFKVYLVEETSSVGGRMSQLDKTFPTNDCSMCLISPRLIEVGKNLNIELLTNSQVQSVEGEAGNFKVKVLKKPRYIDEKKCSGCGDCIEACPVSLVNEFEQGLNNRKATHKRYPQAVPNAFSISKAARPPCKLSCPAGCNGQGYVALISRGKYVEALDHIKQWIPLPAVLGRICNHPCELECNRSELDAPVAIRPLKRFVADFVRKKRETGSIPPEAKPAIDPAKPRVAIVGAGPSGLTCASDLAKKGYPVTIFEASSKPGGQLQSSIPEYRLPKDVLDAEIQDIIGMGIELKLNTPMNEGFTLSHLKTEGYRAVYLAVGAQKGRALSIPGADLPGVWQALDFLRAVNRGDEVKIGKRAVVIGGGNTAMDAARTALRLKATEVTIAYRRSRSEMPASDEEIEQAEQEGIHFSFLTAPLKVIAARGKAGSIECIRMALGQPDSTGRPKAEPVAGSEFSIEAETVIVAVGQEVDHSFLPRETAIKTGRDGTIIADSTTLATGEPGVFAGGDGVTGPKSAVEAIYHGHEAAISIDRYLNGIDLAANRKQVTETPAPLPQGGEKKPRKNLGRLPLERRLATFDEVELCYTEEEARSEAERCLNCGLCSECLQCVAACKANAIDHSMKPEVLDISVGSVILAPGFEPFDAKLKGEYGYGHIPNVVTSLEFERILSASGPFQGKVLRPSDGKHPIKIAWIQCVGSRDESCGRGYCSSICCMQATKQAVIAKEHDSTIQPTIFYNDIRAFGKGFERYYESARKKSGVRYIKSMISTVKELQQSQNLLIEYTGEDGRKVQEEFDAVVLSIGMVPSASTRELAEKLGVATDQFGFCKSDEFQPNVTSRPGVYVAGAFEGPMDIPESVMSGSSAACLASQGISESRGTMLTEKTYPPEICLDGDKPRVGVFVCRCGANIARVVDVAGVTEYAGTLPNVVHAEENLYTCSTDTQNRIIKTIREKQLNRVVVASCSPRTHEPLFQDTIREAGLNKFLFEMANIRDQCSWVHASQPKEANEKARDLVRMAVARASTLQPLQQSPSALNRRALIIGGGMAGMTAALSVAAHGFESVLVEREKELGGNLRHIHFTAEGSNPQELLSSLVRQVEAEPKITVYKGAEVKKLSGYLGNYRTEVVTAGGKSTEVEHGVVIVATGGVEYKPSEYLYGKSDKVLTQLELEARLARGERNLKSVAMIQCVGSREEEHMYCSRVCCTQAVKNALRIKKDNPEAAVYILYRDMRTYGKHELLYRQAREKGVTFIRFDEHQKPQVSESDGKLTVSVHDSVLDADISLEPELLVLSSAIRPQADAVEFASRLKLPLTQDKFYMEAHMKLRPLDFINEGMFLCGLAHSPKSITESIVQAKGAVSRALTILSQPCLMSGGVVAVVDPERCVACLTCVRSCPYHVPQLNGDGVAHIQAAACQGCGICTSSCPRKAIGLQHYEDNQILVKTSALMT